ncbi:MAG: hypothetical protein IJ341_03955 [Bacteroidales bacterium]|nr:hypothetical protein [Bacteroidales bacterium]
MKRILSVLTLSLLFCPILYALSLSDKEEHIKRGDLEYFIYYTDSTKQEIDDFSVWYKPEKYNDLKKYKYDHISAGMSLASHKDLVGKIENLFIRHFGYTKVFNDRGFRNIKHIMYSTHLSTGKVYLRCILFEKGAYNLITDEEILTFIEKFNKDIIMIVHNRDMHDKNAIYNCCGITLFKNREEF